MGHEWELIYGMAGALRKTELFKNGAVDCALQLAGFSPLEIAEFSERAVNYEINRRVHRDVKRLMRRRQDETG